MISRDYIMRMVQMLAVALAKVVFNKELKQYDAAMQEIDAAAKGLLGMNGELLLSFSEHQLFELFRSENQRDKLLAASELLREASEVFREQGRGQEGFLQGMKAFGLFMELLSIEPDYLKVTSADKYGGLVQYLEQYELPLPLEQKRCRYYEIIGRYDAAAQVVEEFADHDASLRDAGAAFYERMLRKPDIELNAGGLSKQQAEEGLARLRRGGGAA